MPAVTATMNSPSQRPLRILYLDTDLGVGGAEMMVRALLDAWAAAGQRPGLLLTYGHGIVGEDIAARGHHVESLNLPRGWRLWLQRRRVQACIDRLAPDAIVLNNRDVLLPWAWTLGQGRVPVFVVIHSTETGGYRRTDWLHRLFLRRYRRIVTLGLPHRDYAAARYRLPLAQLAIVHNGIENEFSTVLAAPLPELPAEAVIAVIAARLHPDKNHRDLLVALAAVLPQHPELHLLVLGQGPLREALEREAQARGIAAHVHFLGARSDVPAVLARAHIGILASTTTETLSIAVLEYMRAGLPVLATRVGSLSDQVLDGETGLLVSPGDAVALAAGLRQLLASATLRARLGAAGKALQQRQFTAGRMAAGYLQLFREELAKR